MQSDGAAYGQYRINHGEGVTLTERLLKDLGERSFLRFWSHTNPHSSPGKELCDLIVVCGDYVIIFSDKSIHFRLDVDTATAWERWYKKAIAKSASQLHGATRHLLTLKSPIYKDNSCTIPLGLPIPAPDKVRLYRVAVVSQSSDVRENEPPAPFLRINSHVVSDRHMGKSASPFVVGDIDPNKDFVHVVDVAGLWAALSEMDTVTDFARYLDARCEFIRGKRANIADSEWCMLTRYLLSFDDAGDQVALDHTDPGTTHLVDAEWQSEHVRSALTRRHQANLESYVWDGLIENQAQMIERRSFAFATYNTIEEAELAVRSMALENRLNRRLLSRAWREVCLDANPNFNVRLRTIPHSAMDGTTYVFLNMSNFANEPYNTYRQARRDLLQSLMLASLVDIPTSEVIVGIAAEYGSAPESYDLAHFDVAANAREELEHEAHEAWLLKKSLFTSLGSSQGDERDIPNP